MSSFEDKLKIILGLDPSEFQSGAERAKKISGSLEETLKKAFSDTTIKSLKGEIDRLTQSTGNLKNDFNNVTNAMSKQNSVVKILQNEYAALKDKSEKYAESFNGIGESLKTAETELNRLSDLQDAALVAAGKQSEEYKLATKAVTEQQEKVKSLLNEYNSTAEAVKKYGNASNDVLGNLEREKTKLSEIKLQEEEISKQGGFLLKFGIDMSGIDKAKAGIEGLKSESSSLGNILRTAFSFTLGNLGFEALQKGFDVTKESVIDFNAEMEQNQLAYTAMTGSAEKAKALLDYFKNYSVKTPYQFKDLAAAGKQLMALGFKSNELPATLKSITDFTSYVGGDADKMNRISYALGEMLTAGNVTGIQMRELVNNSVPAWDILSKAIGKTTGETKKLVEKGAIPAKQAIDAILAGMENKAKDMATKQSTTFTGLMSTLKDSIQITLGSVGNGIFEKSKSLLSDLVKKSQEFADVFSKEGLSEAIKSVFPEEIANRIITFTDFLSSNLIPLLSNLGSNIFKIIAEALGHMTDKGTIANSAINALYGAFVMLNNALSWLANHQDVLNIVVDLLVVKFIGGLATNLTGGLISNILSLASAIGKGGLAGALGELAPFVVANPIAAIAITISALAIASIASYAAKIQEMTAAAQNLQNVLHNGIQSPEDAKKIKNITSVADEKLLSWNASNNQQGKYSASNTPDRAKWFNELYKLGQNPWVNAKDTKEARSLSEKLNVKVPKQFNTAQGIFKYVEEKLGNIGADNFTTDKNSATFKNKQLQQISSNSQDWLNENGFYGMNYKQAVEFNNKLKNGLSYYNKMQGWQNKQINNKTFSKSDENQMKAIQKGIAGVDAERANIIKSKPSILKNSKISGWASLPQSALNETQKKQVEEFKKAQKSYFEKIKHNSLEYNSYGTSLDNKNNVLNILDNYLNGKKVSAAKFNASVTPNGAALALKNAINSNVGNTPQSKMTNIEAKYDQSIVTNEGTVKTQLALPKTKDTLYQAKIAQQNVVDLLQKKYVDIVKTFGKNSKQAITELKSLNAEKATQNSIKKLITEFYKGLGNSIAGWIDNLSKNLAKLISDNDVKINSLTDNAKLFQGNTKSDYDQIAKIYQADLDSANAYKKQLEAKKKGKLTADELKKVNDQIYSTDNTINDLTKKIQDTKTEEVDKLKSLYEQDTGTTQEMILKWSNLLADSLKGGINGNLVKPFNDANFGKNMSITEGTIKSAIIGALDYKKPQPLIVNVKNESSSRSKVMQGKYNGHSTVYGNGR